MLGAGECVSVRGALVAGERVARSALASKRATKYWRCSCRLAAAYISSIDLSLAERVFLPHPNGILNVRRAHLSDDLALLEPQPREWRNLSHTKTPSPGARRSALEAGALVRLSNRGGRVCLCNERQRFLHFLRTIFFLSPNLLPLFIFLPFRLPSFTFFLFFFFSLKISIFNQHYYTPIRVRTRTAAPTFARIFHLIFITFFDAAFQRFSSFGHRSLAGAC